MSEPDEDVPRRWRARCYGMAQATYALADMCDDQEMMHGYMGLAARWVIMADQPPESLPELDPQPPSEQFPPGSDGRAVAGACERVRGKSGLHDDMAAGNARRGRPQG